MLKFSIFGLKARFVMCVVALGFLVFASLFDGYPWVERAGYLVVLVGLTVLVRLAIRRLERGERSGAAIGLFCMLLGPTPVLFGATVPLLLWIWPIGLGVSLAIVWWQWRDPMTAPR